MQNKRKFSDLDNFDKNSIAECIENNNAEESKARANYFSLLNCTLPI